MEIVITSLEKPELLHHERKIIEFLYLPHNLRIPGQVLLKILQQIDNGRRAVEEKYEGGGSLSISRIESSLGLKLTRECTGDSLERSSPLYGDNFVENSN